MPREIEINGVRVRHDGSPPFVARSASDRTDDWPLWYVHGDDRVNRMSFPGKPGAVLTSRASAEAIAAALNGEAT